MRILQIIIATLAATSAMTMFSYLLSEVLKKQFKEPVLLADGLASLNLFADTKQRQIAAWGLHYTIGLIFIIAYDIIWNNTSIDPTWFCGVLFGIISGIIGILGWKLIFRMLPKIVRISFNAYFLQLFLAHVVFALVAVATYNIIENLS